jgi:hypothetical protein
MRADPSTKVASVRHVALLSIAGFAAGAYTGCEPRAAGDRNRPQAENTAPTSTSTLHLEPAVPNVSPGASPRGAADLPIGSAVSDAPAVEVASGAEVKVSGVGVAPSPTCIRGWSTPPSGSVLRKAALDMMRTSPDERFVVTEMRYFLGPEDAEVIRPQREVERWYVKGYSRSEPKRKQRWLVRRAELGRGVDAVAPYASHGYGPDTWRRVDATEEGLADPFLRPCDRTKPGEKCMGLPREVLGCLDGT